MIHMYSRPVPRRRGYKLLIYSSYCTAEEPACQYRRCKRCRFDPRVRKIPWRGAWQPTPVFLPGQSHGQRSLAGYGPQGHKELDMTEGTQHNTAAEACETQGGWLSRELDVRVNTPCRASKRQHP